MSDCRTLLPSGSGGPRTPPLLPRQTDAGEVHVERTLDKGHTDGGARALCPLDLRLGIVEGRWTPMVAKQAVFLVAHLTPAHAQQTLQTLAMMTPSRSRLDRLSKATSARWEKQRAELEKALYRAEVTVLAHVIPLFEKPRKRPHDEKHTQIDG